MFCRNCGTQLTGSFCAYCGARAVQSPPHVQVPPQPYSQPQPPGAGSGAGLKILFVVLGVITFLGMLSFGAIWYGWHKVKEGGRRQSSELENTHKHTAAR